MASKSNVPQVPSGIVRGIELARRVLSGEVITVHALQEQLNCSRATAYRYVAALRRLDDALTQAPIVMH